MSILHQSDRQDWATQPSLSSALALELTPRGQWDLDAAASADNAVASEFYSEERSGLVYPWFGHCWCNPPYAQTRVWVQRAASEIGRVGGPFLVCMLIAYRPDTRVWHEVIWDRADEVRSIAGRLRFVGAQGRSTFPSAVVIFRRRAAGVRYGLPRLTTMERID